MGRKSENWAAVQESVECRICGAAKGEPCFNPYGRVFEGRGHNERRDKYYQLNARRKLEFFRKVGIKVS